MTIQEELEETKASIARIERNRDDLCVALRQLLDAQKACNEILDRIEQERTVG